MGDFIRLIYEWINAHPEWAQLLLFLTAMLDALFIVGAFVPAGIVLFAIGALIALGRRPRPEFTSTRKVKDHDGIE